MSQVVLAGHEVWLIVGTNTLYWDWMLEIEISLFEEEEELATSHLLGLASYR